MRARAGVREPCARVRPTGDLFDLSLLLEGKRAFVTGGTRGIGAALCEVFAREGADVAFNYHSRDELAEETRRKVEAHGRRSQSFKIPVTDRVALKHMTRELVKEWGGLDVLVNNAAINRGDNFATTTDRAWDEVIDTNVNSLFGFTKCLSREAATFGVTVNAIAAGIFDTELAHELPERLIQMHQFWAAAGRMGRPAELAEIAAFLVSERNSFMNGEVIIVDGGAVT